MLESEKVGFVLLKVKAVDIDSHHNEISYFMKESQTHFEVDEKTGQITLKEEVDFEVTPELIFSVVATDKGEPPLSAEARVTVEMLDVNDNAPKFSSAEFHAKISENIPIGSKVLKIEAHDADSAHYGSVAYRIVGDQGDAFEIKERYIVVKNEIDFEKTKAYEFEIEASDGGEPSLKANATVRITVIDVNDNVPQFEQCNLTAVIQEGTNTKLPLLQMVVKDKDGPGNGDPFRVELTGDGADRFFVDKNLHLLQKSKKLTKNTYKLTATAYDIGNLSSQCPVTVYVKEQSRHPPEINSMVITLNTVMGEFLGGRIGVVRAQDRDKEDMLRYAVHPDVEGFRIDPDSGALIAQSDLLAGIYRLNATVTDGQFTVAAPIIVDVSSVDQDALDHSISIRVKNMNGAKFLENHLELFHKAVAKHLNVQPTHVRILSLQEIPTDHHHSHRLRYRKRRNLERTSTDLDVLFTVSRGDSRGYLRPIHVRQRLEQSAVEISDVSKLEIVALTTEVCRRDLCAKGECRDRLWLESSGDFTEYDSFISPRHKRTFECICKEGYGGRKCDVAVDRCSREQCSKEEMCIATVDEPGFRCVCPPGRKGERCTEMACEGERDCSQTAELSVAGDGYIHMTISTSLESRLELSVELKTLSTDATILYARGKSDFHQIRLVDGYAEYRWDCGTGEGLARVPHTRISDGKWHVLKVSRRGRHSRLAVDDTYSGEGYSPPGSDVINLYSSGMTLVLGARVEYQNEVLHDVFSVVPFEHQTASDVAHKVTDGVTACFRRISIDGLTLPKTRQGIRLHNVNIGCAALDANPCSSQPCQNDAACSTDPTSVTGFKCHCPARYSGSTCEIDLNACASNPCPNGVACQSLFNDFLCMCPAGFSGKTCQHRGQWNPCASSPCGPYGQCYPNHFSQTGYECLCARGYAGTNCSQKIPDFMAHFWPLSLIELVAVIAVICLLIAIIILTICICRKKTTDDRKISTETKDDDVRHSLIHKPPPDSPPPLPPRSYRPQFSNLESAQMTGLPTVQVRPLPTHERLSSGGRCDSRSPSLADSGHSHWRKSTRHGSVNLDAARQYGSAADDLEQLGRLGIVRRHDRPIPEHTNGAFSSASGLGDSIQCLPTTEEAIPNIDRIDDAVDSAIEFRNERIKLEQLTSNVNGNPVDESDYMTMRPIKRRSQIHDSCESQRRPLLEATSDSDGCGTATTDVDFVYPPKPPKHGAPPPLYDNPAPETAEQL
uniref:Cadherin domain protein n=1 Tax=Steinernema glaseri TaxID=37863 RepID=A0A1I8AC89_9BILA